MKCPKCGKELKDYTYTDRYDEATDETYRVYCDYHFCEFGCKYCDMPHSAWWGDLMIKSREKRWGEWIASQLTSFQEIEEKFLTRSEVISLIKNYDGERALGLEFFTKKDLIKDLDFRCIHFLLFGRKYYLKRCVAKYLYCGNGLFKLKEEKI